MWQLKRHFMYSFTHKNFLMNQWLVNCSITGWIKIDSNMSSAKFYQIFNRYKDTFYNKNKIISLLPLDQ